MSCWRYTPSPNQDHFQDLLEAICPDFSTQLYPNKITIIVIPTNLNCRVQKLCCVRTRQQYSDSLDYFVTSLPPYLHQFLSISGGNCIRLTVSSFDSQANQSNQSSIQ